MSYETLKSYATQALACTEQMYFLAQNEKWEDVSRLEAERLDLIETIFNHPTLPTMLGKLANTIRRIIEIDQMTISLGKDAHCALKKEMELLTQGKRVVDSYLENAI